MSQMKTIKFPGDSEPREVVDAAARARLKTLEESIETVIADDDEGNVVVFSLGAITATSDGNGNVVLS